jgi:hypothetical protein
MDVAQIRTDLVDGLQSALPFGWSAMARLSKAREAWSPPVAVIGSMRVVSDYSMGMGRIDVQIVLVTAMVDELDDAADVDEMIDDSQGSPLMTFVRTLPTSGSWNDMQLIEASVSDEIRLGPLDVRGAEWSLSLFCPR